MTPEFSTWLAVALQAPAIQSLPIEEQATITAAAARHDSIDQVDPEIAVILRSGWAACMAGESNTFVPPVEGGDWEAEDEAVGVQMKALQAQDIEWAGL